MHINAIHALQSMRFNNSLRTFPTRLSDVTPVSYFECITFSETLSVMLGSDVESQFVFNPKLTEVRNSFFQLRTILQRHRRLLVWAAAFVYARNERRHTEILLLCCCWRRTAFSSLASLHRWRLKTWHLIVSCQISVVVLCICKRKIPAYSLYF